MLPVLTIVDDFLPEDRAIQIRNDVLKEGWNTVMVKEGDGLPEVPYQNVNVSYKVPDFAEGLAQVFGLGIAMHQQAFRFGFRESQLHNLVHADHCCAKLAAVYYMNEPEDCRGGTAFWRHKLGWDMMPTEEQLKAANYSIEAMAQDWHDASQWDMISLAGMKPNRLITYPTNAFHSRWPWQGFGNKEQPEHARLIYCAMFDVL